MESSTDALFRHLDQDGNGLISTGAAPPASRLAVCRAAGPQLTRRRACADEVESLLTDLGADTLRAEDGMMYLSGGQKSSGEITFDEFLQFRGQVRSPPASVSLTRSFPS